MSNINNKLLKLKGNIKKYNKVIVAFSGGVDSSFLLVVCAETLDKGSVTAVTASSATYTEAELSSANEIVSMLGVRHIIMDTDELSDPAFTANPPERCYHCKKCFYDKLRYLSDDMNISAILDGSNTDDISDYRPGRRASAEAGVISPLIEHGFSKQDIRDLSRGMNLPNWDKPANPCLASRIPYGSSITKEKLKAIAKAEAFIRDMGFSNVRVRHHDKLARIEIPAQDLLSIMRDDTRERVSSYLNSLGFVWVSVDIVGYRTGSLNKVIEQDITKNSNQ